MQHAQRQASLILASMLWLGGATGCGELDRGERFIATGNEVFDERDTDTESDGVPDPCGPTPPASMRNRLTSVYAGGAARVVEIGPAAMGDGWDLEAGCSSFEAPQAVLCDADDSLSFSKRIHPSSGPRWRGDGEHAWGALVVDACYDGSCRAIDFNEARVFQAFADGKTTHVRLSVHPERSDDAPAWDDPDWHVIVDEEPVRAGRDPFGNASTVGDPAVFAPGAHVTRYLRVEASNDGAHGGDASLIQLRAVKLFAASTPEIAVDARRVFVSSETYDGNLGGLEAADDACQRLADASVRVNGSFKAFLPDREAGVHRLEHAEATYVRPDGTFIADGFDALIHEDTQWPIDLDQHLTRVSASRVWAGYGCDGFTSAAGYAGISSTNLGMVVKGVEPCDADGVRIYCIEQQ